MSNRESRAIVRGSAHKRSQSKEEPPSISDATPLRIVLLGKSVSENSEVGNLILGRSAFDSEAPPDVVEKAEGRLKHRHVILINSPQLLHANISDPQITQTARECVSLSDPGPHVVLLLLQHGQCSAQDQQRLEKLLDYFSEDLLQHSMVLNTREPTQTNDILEKIIHKCSNRHFSLRGSSSPEGLLQALEDIEQSNEGRHLLCASQRHGERLNVLVCGSDSSLKSFISELKHQRSERVRTKVDPLLNVLELPALFNTGLSEEEVTRQTLHCVSHCHPGVHAFLLIIPDSPLNNQDRAELEEIQRIFSSRINKHLMILIKQNSEHQTAELNEETQAVIESFGGRHHFFGPKTQLSTLMENIEQMVEENRGGFYSTETFLEAQTKKLLTYKEIKKRNSLETNLLTKVSASRQNTDDELRIVLLGKTGVGKSTTGNTILGRGAFTAETSHQPVTKVCQIESSDFSGRPVTVIDTPGLFDTELTNEEIQREIRHCISMILPGPHVFLLLVPLGRFTKEEETSVKIIQETFGENSLMFTIVLFTRGDFLGNKTIKNYLGKPGSPLMNLIEACGSRFHVFNNNQTEDRTQVSDLLEKIDNMVKANGGNFYSCKIFREMEREKQEQQMKILNDRVREAEERVKKLEEEKDRMKKMMDEERQNHETEKKRREEELKKEIREEEKHQREIQEQMKRERETFRHEIEELRKEKEKIKTEKDNLRTEYQTETDRLMNRTENERKKREEEYTEKEELYKMQIREKEDKVKELKEEMKQEQEEMRKEKEKLKIKNDSETDRLMKIIEKERQNHEMERKRREEELRDREEQFKRLMKEKEEREEKMQEKMKREREEWEKLKEEEKKRREDEDEKREKELIEFKERMKEEKERMEKEKEDFQSKHKEEENKMKMMIEKIKKEREELMKKLDAEGEKIKMMEEEREKLDRERKRREEEFREREERYKRLITEREQNENEMLEQMKLERMQWEKQKEGKKRDEEMKKEQEKNESQLHKRHQSPVSDLSAGGETLESNPLRRKIPEYVEVDTPASCLPTRRIVLLGQSGVGKSTAGNTILGKRKIFSVMSSNSVTSVCSEAQATVSGRSVSVVDTPGLFDTKMNSEELTKEIARCVYISSPGPHAFLIVLKVDRFTEQEQPIPQLIEMMFGQDVLKYSIILFTHGDLLKGTTVEKLIEENCRLRALVQQCGGRYQLFNNRDLNNREQVNDLLQKIDSMVQQNGGGHYTNQMYEDAQRLRQEEEEKKKQQKEKQRQEEIERRRKEIEERTRRLYEDMWRKQREEKQDKCVCS